MQRITLFNGFGVSAVGALCVSVLLHAAPASPVADAAQRGDNGAVRALLKQAADVNAAQPDGMTALHWAATRDDGELAQMLLYAGADVKATTVVVDLNAFGRNSAAFNGVLFGNPVPPPPAPADAAPQGQAGQGQRSGRGAVAEGRGATPGGAAGGAAGGPGGGRNPFAGRAGIDRQYKVYELVLSQGGVAPLVLNASQGFI